MAKLSEMIKPTVEEQNIAQIIDETLDKVRGEVTPVNLNEIIDFDLNDDDEDFGSELAASVDYLRRCRDFLVYFLQTNEHSKFMGEKGSDALRDTVEEVEDFLGEYQS